MNRVSPPRLTVDGSRPLSPQTIQAVNAVCDVVEDTGLPTPVVVSVSGVPASAKNTPLPLVNKWERALRRLERLDVPTVALATGDCGGTALEALLATDFRIAAPGTRLLPLAGTEAVWPGMALYRLVNQAGVAATRRAVLFGAAIDAEEARELRLIDEIAADPAAALEDRFGAFSTGVGLGVRRQLMLDASTTSFEEALGRHLAACDRVLRDTAAGIGS